MFIVRRLSPCRASTFEVLRDVSPQVDAAAHGLSVSFPCSKDVFYPEMERAFCLSLSLGLHPLILPRTPTLTTSTHRSGVPANVASVLRLKPGETDCLLLSPPALKGHLFKRETSRGSRVCQGEQTGLMRHICQLLLISERHASPQ